MGSPAGRVWPRQWGLGPSDGRRRGLEPLYLLTLDVSASSPGRRGRRGGSASGAGSPPAAGRDGDVASPVSGHCAAASRCGVCGSWQLVRRVARGYFGEANVVDFDLVLLRVRQSLCVCPFVLLCLQPMMCLGFYVSPFRSKGNVERARQVALRAEV